MQNPTFGEDLDKPLGGERPPPGRAERGFAYVRVALGGLVVLAIALGSFVYLTSDLRDGQPAAVAQIGVVKPPPGPAAASPPASADITTGSVRRQEAASAEATSGVRVVRQGGGAAPGALIIEVPEADGVRLNPAPDKRISQKFERGVLPRIGKDGLRAADVYKRPMVWPKRLRAGAPRIAIVVGGMGLSRNATAEAVEKLPGDVTLAFAPYGPDLAGQAADARAQGHEIMLQAPMEPIDYPANDPGPKTLTAAAPVAQNLDRLHWLMSRFSGYVGVTNFLGGKFTADTSAFLPVLREVGERGLVYLDDGTSPRSLAKSLGTEARVPVLTSDVVIDAAQRPEAIDAALVRLEAAARANGAAVGSATGLPVSVDRIALWSRGLEARGIALVPLSALALRPYAVSVAPSPER